jgi:uncharacterized membrane protein
MIYVLRLLHILSGVFWVGSVLFTARFLMPSLRAAGPAAAPVMAQLGQRKMPLVMMTTAFVTIASGIWLMVLVSGGNVGAWMRSGPGRTFGLGGALAIITLVLGMIINMPAANRMAAINQGVGKRGGQPTPDESAELQRLQRRVGIGAQIVSVLLVLATAAMALARYVP